MGRVLTIACVGAAVLAGCGGSDDKQATACASQSMTHYIAYQARGHATPSSLAATVKALCDRARAAGSTGVAVRSRGAREIDIAGPLRPPARIAFYDWEPNLRPRSQSKPTPSRADALRTASRQKGPVVVVADEQAGYWVIADRPELTNADIRDPKQTFDSVTNEPAVIFSFTARGARAFERATRREAQRGARLGKPQTFAIVVDDRIVSRPQIDYRQNPGGLRADNGAQITGGASIQEARDLAASLKSPPLPLELVRVGSR